MYFYLSTTLLKWKWRHPSTPDLLEYVLLSSPFTSNRAAIKTLGSIKNVGCGEKRNPNPLLVGMQAGTTTLEKNLETS
jgi:hypothetical protein